MSSISVKVLDVEDSAEVAAFLSAAHVEMGRPRPPSEVSNLIRTWLEEQKNEMCSLVAFKNERVVGIAVLDERDPSITYVQWVHVLREYRRQKVGSSLMEATLARVKRKRTPLTSLHTTADNIAAQGLYGKFGFVSLQPPGNYMVNFQHLPLLQRFQELNPKAEAKPLGKQTDFHGRKVLPISWKDESTGREIILYFERGMVGSSIPLEGGSVNLYLVSSGRSPVGFDPRTPPGVSAGSTVYLKLVLENQSSREITGLVRIKTPQFLKIHPQRRRFAYKLSGKEHTSFVYRVKVPADLKATFVPIGSEILIDGSIVPLESSLRTGEPFELTISPARIAPAPSEKLKINLGVKSNLPKPSTLEVSLEPSKDWNIKRTEQFKNVIPNETVSLDAQIVAPSQVEPGNIEIPVRIKWIEGEYQTKTRLAVGLPTKCPTCGGFVQYPYWTTIEGVRMAFCRETCAERYGLPETEIRRNRLWESLEKGHRWLRDLRRPDGGWRLPHRDGSLVYPGTSGLSSLASFEGKSSSSVQMSRQWLAGTQSEDGSIGDGPSTTASAIMSLFEAGESPESPFLRKAASYLRRTQNSEGFWEGWMGPELTTLYCIQALSRMGEPANSKTNQSAFSWVLSKQRPDGSFFDVPAPFPRAAEVIATTSTGLTALALLSIADMDIKVEPNVSQNALNWLKENQQAEGYWGTAENPNPFDTAMAVQALLTFKGLEVKQQVEKGVEWLLDNQQPNGSWRDLVGATHIIIQSLAKIKSTTQIF